MRTWKDSEGRPWTIQIDVMKLRQIRMEAWVDLADLSLKPETAWPEILSDPVKLYEVIWLLIQSQAEERGIDALGIAAAFTGDAIQDARESLWFAMSDFIPAQRRSLMHSLWARMKEADASNLAKAVDLLNQPEMSVSESSEPVTILPESWESTLGG